jgi:phosphohistidine phosphatase
MKTRPWWFYKQSGVIPYRVADEDVEVLLITSRRRARWIIPKGVIDPGQTAEESARKEAYEEAGITGEVSSTPLGEYEYHKWGGVCRVKVYLMEVKQVLDSWPEGSTRERRWLTLEEAAAAVKEERLKELILTVPRSLARP